MTEGSDELNRTATAKLGPSARPMLLLPEHAPSNGEAIPEQPPPAPRTWRQELPRWLATLDGARTRREYEKAVGYFFTAPGVPQALSDLSFDLLLAYRGRLALRTHRSTQTRAQRGTPSRGTRLDQPPTRETNGLSGLLRAVR